ncbi:MAG: monovalent cation/H(+) antiporter subunit G [Lachnospiraceae bacterium]|nr:monovalent cation/H(+) antiporter subunit G [Lachnospiraceae bacterium]
MIGEIIALILFVAGTLIFITATFGVYKFKYVLNRMHAAALGDTLGILLAVAGGVVYYGFQFISLKLILIVVFLWLSSPVASHFIAKLEYTTDPEAEGEEFKSMSLSELEKEENNK